MSSWLISGTFSELRVDIWCPGDFINYAGSRCLLNVMCGITQFLVIVLVPGATLIIIIFH